MYEDEQANVEKSVQTHMLLESVKRLESRIRNKYHYDYPYREIEVPKYCGNYPYNCDEAKQLLEIIYGLLKKLEGYLQSKGVYEYYDKYFEEYYSLFNELCDYYQIDIDEFEGYKNFKQLLSKEELEEFEKVERVAELVNRPELVEQYLKKVKWSRMTLEEKLGRLIDQWWNEKKKREKLSKQPTYAGKTVEEWIQELDLKGKGKKLAREKPWMLITPGGRHVLKQIDKRVIIYDD